jgi:hypothetical protein
MITQNNGQQNRESVGKQGGNSLAAAGPHREQCARSVRWTLAMGRDAMLFVALR